MISVKNIVKTYGKKDSLFKALSNVSFSIPEGSTVAIVGKSGSGKSTLMHIMSGLDHPDSGAVMIGDQELHKLKGRKMDKFRSTEMSFIFQAFFVEANQTCYQNVSLPLEIAEEGQRKIRIEDALGQVGLKDKIDAKAGNLSGGQKQRLAIARAIVNKPKLIFADEPTGNLDTTTGEVIINLLLELNKKRGITIVIVTHDQELAQRCDEQIFMKDGEIKKTVKLHPGIKSPLIKSAKKANQ